MSILSKFFGTRLGWHVLTYNCYEVGHTWNPSCIGASLQILVAAFKESLRIYSSLYIVTTLLRTASFKKVQWKRLTLDILRSTLFLTSNAFFFLYILCLIRRALGFWIVPTAGFTNAFIASFISILIERKSRRGLLALYLTNLASEVVYRMLINRNYLRPLPHGETVLFSLALAGYMYLLRSNQLSGDVAGALRFVFAIPKGPGHENKIFGYSISSLPSAVQSAISLVRNYFGKHSTCPHAHSCVSNAIQGFLRNFPFAYLVSVALRFATSFSNLIKNPTKIPSVFFSRSALRVPLFIGLLPFLFSASTCTLRRLLGRDDPFIHSVGGLIAGMAMLAYPSTSISMYLLWKLIEVLYFKFADMGYLPRWRHFDILLYSISTGFVLFAAIVEPHALRPAYWKFLMGLTDKKFLIVVPKRMDPDQYFRRCVSLLRDYQWLHDIKMVEFFIRKPWLDMPKEWLDYLLGLSFDQLIKLPTSSHEDQTIPSLRAFLSECKLLSIVPAESEPIRTSSFILSKDQRRGISAKKAHEIERLVPIIGDMYKKHAISVVIDIGCGHGNLCRILAETIPVKVLGIDCNTCYCRKAETRIEKSFQLAALTRFAVLDVKSVDVRDQLEHIIGDFYCDLINDQGFPNCMIISLHGCADLQPICYELFSTLHFVKAFVGIGCCYHNMEYSNKKGFVNFPLSRSCKIVWNADEYKCQFSPYSMRLALQDSLNEWQTKTEDVRKCRACSISEGAIKQIADIRAGKLVETKYWQLIIDEGAKPGWRFSTLIKLYPNLPIDVHEMYKSELESVEKECEAYKPIIEPFSMLQSALKDVIESMILFDRFRYLKDLGFTCALVPVFDPDMSPRNKAVIAEKGF